MINTKYLLKIAEDLQDLNMQNESVDIIDSVVEMESPVEQEVQEDDFSDIDGYDSLEKLVMGVFTDMLEHGNLEIVGEDLDTTSKSIFTNYLTQLMQNPIIS